MKWEKIPFFELFEFPVKVFQHLLPLQCRSRASIEGHISHLKLDHRLLRNYLKGTQSDHTNTLLAAAAYNMMKWMRMKRQVLFVFIFKMLYQAFFFISDSARYR